MLSPTRVKGVRAVALASPSRKMARAVYDTPEITLATLPPVSPPGTPATAVGAFWASPVTDHAQIDVEHQYSVATQPLLPSGGTICTQMLSDVRPMMVTGWLRVQDGQHGPGGAGRVRMRSWPHVGQTTALGGGGVGLIGVCGMKTGVNVGGWTKMRVSVG